MDDKATSLRNGMTQTNQLSSVQCIGTAKTMNDARRGYFRFWMTFVVRELVVLHNASIAILTFGRPKVHTYVYSMYHL